jgi:hypothetical protein
VSFVDILTAPVCCVAGGQGERRAKWVKDAEQFRTVFPRLVEYRRVFGDCKVPRNYRYDFQLGDLVHSKRNLHKHDQLPAYQRKWLVRSASFLLPALCVNPRVSPI